MLSYKEVLKKWNDFFFVPKPTESIALFRILWGLLLLVYFLNDLGNVQAFYGPHAILSFETVKAQFSYPHANVFQFLGNSNSTVYFLQFLLGLATLSMILGFYTRFSVFLTLILMTSFHQRNIWLLSSSEVLLRLVTLYLFFSPCGHSLSLDALIGRRFGTFQKTRDWAPWALRLIQIQIAVVYLWTVWHKLKGETWFDGTAVYYATRLESMKNFEMSWLLDSMSGLRLMSWGTLILETALGAMIWFKEFRRPLILMGILFHLGIELTMSIPFFEYVMIVLLLSYFSPEEARALVDDVRKRFERGWGQPAITQATTE